MAERDALKAEVERLRGKYTELRTAILAYIEYHSLEHEGRYCPEDDTCTCPMVLAIEKALAGEGEA